MDGLERMNGVVVLAATSRPHMVDPALLRPGRLETVLTLPLPDRQARLAILRVYLRGKPLAEDVDQDWLADVTEGLLGSHIEALCRRAAMLAIRELVEGDGSLIEPATLQIAMRHFRQALREQVPSLNLRSV